MKSHWQCPNCGNLQTTRITCRVCGFGNFIASVLALALTACSGDVFTGFEGGLVQPETGADSSADGDSDSDLPDSGGLDARVDSDATPDAPCEHGTPACVNVVTTYCAKLKACCANTCPYSWANNGGSDCENHYLSTSANTYCSNNFVADQNRAARCDEPCLGDIQTVSCTLIKQNQNGPGISQISSSCQAFWQ